MEISSEIKKIIDNINSDAIVIKDVSSGSDAYTFLEKKGDQYFYRKIALSQTGGVNALKLQLDFLFKYGQELDMVKIGSYASTDEYCYYDMLVNLDHINFFKFICDLDTVTPAWKILKSILTLLESFHKSHPAQLNMQKLSEYILSKVTNNSKIIMEHGGEYIEELQKYDSIFINGKEYKNLAYYLGENGIIGDTELIDIFKNDKCSTIHGDFTIDNIIFDPSNENGAYLIDPNVSNLHESSFLDYAKMLQSLHGNYEYYRHSSEIKINGNIVSYDLGNTKIYKELFGLFDEYLKENFTGKEYKSIYTHELIHWLRLMPYKIRKNEKTAVLFYCQLLITLSEWEEKFKRNN